MPLMPEQTDLVRRKLHTRIHELEAFISQLAEYEDDLVRQIESYRLSGLKLRDAVDQAFRDVDQLIAGVLESGRQKDLE